MASANSFCNKLNWLSTVQLASVVAFVATACTFTSSSILMLKVQCNSHQVVASSSKAFATGKQHVVEMLCLVIWLLLYRSAGPGGQR